MLKLFGRPEPFEKLETGGIDGSPDAGAARAILHTSSGGERGTRSGGDFTVLGPWLEGRLRLLYSGALSRRDFGPRDIPGQSGEPMTGAGVEH
jgi:hypothetical protein